MTNTQNQPEAIAEGHNPDQLTNEQVGVPEWRLLTEEESVDTFRPIPNTSWWREGGWSEGTDLFHAYDSWALRTKLTPAELRAARGLQPIQPASEPAHPVSLNLGETQHPVACGCWYCCTDATRSTPAAQPVPLEQLAEGTMVYLDQWYVYSIRERDILRAYILRALQQATAQKDAEIARLVERCGKAEAVVDSICARFTDSRPENISMVVGAYVTTIQGVKDRLLAERNAALQRCGELEKERDEAIAKRADYSAVDHLVIQDQLQRERAAHEATKQQLKAQTERAEYNHTEFNRVRKMSRGGSARESDLRSQLAASELRCEAMRARVLEIADDFHPSGPEQYGLALQEMRDALNNLALSPTIELWVAHVRGSLILADEAISTCRDHCEDGGLGSVVAQSYDSKKMGEAHIAIRKALATPASELVAQVREALSLAVEVVRAYSNKEQSGKMTHYYAQGNLPHLERALQLIEGKA